MQGFLKYPGSIFCDCSVPPTYNIPDFFVTDFSEQAKISFLQKYPQKTRFCGAVCKICPTKGNSGIPCQDTAVLLHALFSTNLPFAIVSFCVFCISDVCRIIVFDRYGLRDYIVIFNKNNLTGRFLVFY